MPLPPLRLTPILKPRAWGGRSLERLGKPLPPGTPIGERELAAIELAEKTAWKRQLRGPRSDALRADVALAILRRADDERWSAFALLRVVENGAEALPNIPRRWMAVGEARKIVRDRLADEGLNSMATEIRDPREAFERAIERTKA